MSEIFIGFPTNSIVTNGLNFGGWSKEIEGEKNNWDKCIFFLFVEKLIRKYAIFQAKKRAKLFGGSYGCSN
jgi:hypothetical protein